MEATAGKTQATTPIPAELMRAFDAAMASTEGESFAATEIAALALANELVRLSLERDLARRAAGLSTEVMIDGVRYRRHAPGVGTYHSLCGRLEVQRASYRRVGVHNGPIVIPLELMAGLMDHATPEFAASATQGHASMPLRDYEKQMAAAHRPMPARSTLARVVGRVADRVRAALPVIEPLVRATEVMPDGVAAISLGLDRTATPMAEARDASAPAAPRRRRTRPYQRRAPDPIDVVYRMAYVGTFALHDAAGNMLVSRRFATSAEDGPTEVVSRLFAELNHVRATHARLPIAVVQDGAPELWNLMQAACTEHAVSPVHEVIDRYHVDERLAAILALVAASDRSAAELRRRWATWLDRSDTAMDRIARELDDIYSALVSAEPPTLRPCLRRQLRKHVYRDRTRELAGHIEYIQRNRGRMRYASVARGGMPIGSGVTEGACKSTVGIRCKRSGQRWRNHGLSTCLRLRALDLSDRLAPCVDRLRIAYTREVRPLA